MGKKIFLLILVTFLFLNLFAVSAQDNETAIDDASEVNEMVSLDVSVSDETINVADSPNVGAIDPNLEPPNLVLLSFNTTDLVKIYKNDSQFVVDARNTYCDSISFIIYDGGLNINNIYVGVGNIISFRNCKVNESGFATLNIDLNPGTYYIDASAVRYTANNMYIYRSTNKITVLPTLIGENLVKYYRNGTQYFASFLNGDGTPLADTNVTFNINGIFYIRKTNDEGIAKLNINLEPGNHIVTAIHPDTGYMYSNKIAVLPTIIGSDLVKEYNDTNQYYATFLTADGNPLADTNVTFNINGVFYTHTTNGSGVARLDINLPVGKYIITAYHPNDMYRLSNTVKVLSSNATYSFEGVQTFGHELYNGENPYGLPGKKVLIDADGESDAMKKKLAAALRAAGWEVTVGDTYSNAHYEDYYNVPKDYVLINIYNSFCAGTIRELASSSIQDLLNSKNVVCVQVFDTAEWTNPQGMAPYRYGNFSGYSASRAWDDNFSITDPSISDVDQYLYDNNIKYCAYPTVDGIMYQFLQGGYFASVGR